jgi:plasmid stabilization system protein ParE
MKLVWTEPAVIDLESIRDYISKDSEYYASLFIERIIIAVEKIALFPQLGREVPEYKTNNIREVLFYNYRLIYEIKDNEIFILTIVHGARDLSNSHPWDFSG